MLCTTCSFSSEPFQKPSLSLRHYLECTELVAGGHSSEQQALSYSSKTYCLAGHADNYAIECLITFWLNAINNCRVEYYR